MKSDLSVPEVSLFAREHHLAVLEEAFALSRVGFTMTVFVHGSLGMGISTMLRRFLDSLPEALVLEGRSYPPDRVPYKTLAPLLDRLAHHLAELPRVEATLLLPPDLDALARLFPVFRPWVSEAPPSGLAGAHLDLWDVRRRAIDALRTLLARIASRLPVVLALDDLHMGDADSAAILQALVLSTEPLPLLLLAAYRSEDSHRVALVTALRRRMLHGQLTTHLREIHVGPLSQREARALARTLLGGDVDTDSIARASGGSPLQVHARVRCFGVDPANLPVPARRLLVALALAGEPTPLAVLGHAAGVDAPEEACALLCAEHLVTKRAGVLEPPHPWIRDQLLAQLSPDERRALRARFAQILDDPGELVEHLEAAGDRVRARMQAERAADRAAEVLAWDQAVRMYERALAPDGNPLALLLKRMATLERAGDAAAAGRAMLDAAEHAPALQHRAVALLLHAGKLQEGLDAARALDGVLPASPTRARVSLLYRRAHLALRGWTFRARPVQRAEPALVEDGWSLAHALEHLDPVVAAEVRVRSLLHALDAGEPSRMARAAASEALALAAEGDGARAARVLDQAWNLAHRAEEPYGVAWVRAAAVGVAFHDARFADTVTLGERALDGLRGSAVPITWEIGAVSCGWWLPALYHLGRLRELSVQLPFALEEAEQRGAAYRASVAHALLTPQLLLAADRPMQAWTMADELVTRWPHPGLHVQRWCALTSRIVAALYQGHGRAAHEAMEALLVLFRAAPLRRIAAVRVESLRLWGLTAMAVGAREVAVQVVKALQRAPSSPAKPHALALAAALAQAQGHLAEAARGYDDAARGYADLAMELHRAAALWRKAEVTPGRGGRMLARQANARLCGLGIDRPARIAATLIAEANG